MIPNCMAVDWNQVKERYLKDEGAQTREDVSFVLGEMMGELNASHTYFGGGDNEREKAQPTGYLGVDWKADGKYYAIKKIIKGSSLGCGNKTRRMSLAS